MQHHEDDQSRPGSLPVHESFLRATIDSLLDPLVVLRAERDPAGFIIDFTHIEANRVACEQRGVEPGDLIGHRLRELLNPADAAGTIAAYAHIVETGSPLRLSNRWYPDGNGDDVVRLYDMQATKVGDGLCVTWRDVTDRKTNEEALRTAATTDPLTGLWNRAAAVVDMTRQLELGRDSGYSTGVILLDLDRFRYVNDSLGHGVGDELLRAAASRVESMTRDGDLVGRHGGDEFIIFMHRLDDAIHALDIADRLNVAFRTPLEVGDHSLVTTASIGIAIMGASEATAVDLIRDADTALYAAKDAGRDRSMVFNDDLRAVVDERLRIANDLRAALELDQLVVWYQPEFDLRTNEICAVEALVRWNHPAGSMRPAGWFIEAAEDSGIIFEIGEFVLRSTCVQAAAWARTRPVTVRVNLSTMQLSEHRLIDVIDRAIEDSGLDPRLLCVEITETALLRDADAVRRNLAAIHERGMQISIDDFGTGYASLTYLQEFPVDSIKIDRSFVSRLSDGPDDRRLIAGVIALADSMDIPVIAEGVEDREQERALRELGCSSAQGWLYSKAVPPTEITRMFEAEHGTR
jgi:diguanylate cyclase (GGDEF)-like protein